MPQDYYNTNLEEAEVLWASEAHARTQETEILRYFRMYPKEVFSPQAIQRMFPRWILTSIRRAMTNLTIKGYLEKTDFRIMEQYGKQVHTWRLAPSNTEEHIDVSIEDLLSEE